MLFIVNGMVDFFDIRTTDFESIYEAVTYEIYPVSMKAAVKSLLVGKHDGLGGAIMDNSGSPFAIYQALIASGYESYKQLAIILEKEGNIEGALKLSKQALKQGWTDNYEKRIDKLNQKLAK